MEELIEWLVRNKIQHNTISDDVIEVVGMGKMLYQNTEEMNSIFRTNADNEVVFNCIEDAEVLQEEEINYVTFKFGNNWYYTDIRKEFALNILKYIGDRVSTSCDIEFVNLGIHTPYELLNGSFMPKEWARKAKYLGHNAIGVCDKNTMASLFNFQKDCDAIGITPIFGYTLTVNDGADTFEGKVYVQSQKGLRNLLRIQKAIMVDSDDKTIGIEELLGRGEGNVFVFATSASNWMANNIKQWEAKFRASFDKVFYQVDLSEYKAERIDIVALNNLKVYFDNPELSSISPILISDCYYLDKDDAKNKIILNKIAEGTAHDQSDDQYFKDIDEHWTAFENLFDSEKRDIKALFEQCCANTVEVANGAKARFETSRNFMPKYDMTEEEIQKYGNTHNMFNELLEEGLQHLVPEADRERYRKQMEFEKYVIESTNNVDYLLVQYDTVNFCKREGILVGAGRGSAAGSLLLYLLGITLVDPLKHNLIFERFLLPERAGLYAAQTTVVGEDVQSKRYVEVVFDDGRTLKIDVDAQLIIKREGVEESITIYADELQADDDILFDNKDALFTINEL